MKDPFDRKVQASNEKAKIIAGIERLSTLFKSTIQSHAKQHGLSPLQVQIILFLAHHDAELCNTTSLAKEFLVTKPTISDAIKVLISKGSIEKTQHTKDARAALFTLTDKGKVESKSMSTVMEPLISILDTSTESEIDNIWQGILVLIQKLQEREHIPMRVCFSCKHFKRADNNGEEQYYCHLLEASLSRKDLRIDCPEHQLKLD